MKNAILKITATIIFSFISLLAGSATAQDSNVDIRGRVLIIETDEADDLVEVHFENGDAVIQISQYQNGELNGLLNGAFRAIIIPGFVTNFYANNALEHGIRTRDLDRFDQIEISTFGGK